MQYMPSFEVQSGQGRSAESKFSSVETRITPGREACDLREVSGDTVDRLGRLVYDAA
jgi:hypothetical protein